MNFLAHAYLSFGDECLLVGNFIADKVKGKKFLDFPIGIQKGILLHRQIDDFTDKHPVVLSMISLYSQNQGIFSPVINDIFMDHFLAKNWSSYHTITLQDFVNHALAVLEKYQNFIPKSIQDFISFAKQTNRLVEYGTVEGVEITLKQVGKKILSQPRLESAIVDLQLHYEKLEALFTIYFPELIQFSKTWISQNFQNIFTEN
jgi:acyl carrier protein phosphodiesterase